MNSLRTTFQIESYVRGILFVIFALGSLLLESVAIRDHGWLTKREGDIYFEYDLSETCVTSDVRVCSDPKEVDLHQLVDARSALMTCLFFLGASIASIGYAAFLAKREPRLAAFYIGWALMSQTVALATSTVTLYKVAYFANHFDMNLESAFHVYITGYAMQVAMLPTLVVFRMHLMAVPDPQSLVTYDRSPVPPYSAFLFGKCLFLWVSAVGLTLACFFPPWWHYTASKTSTRAAEDSLIGLFYYCDKESEDCVYVDDRPLDYTFAQTKNFAMTSFAFSVLSMVVVARLVASYRHIRITFKRPDGTSASTNIFYNALLFFQMLACVMGVSALVSGFRVEVELTGDDDGTDTSMEKGYVLFLCAFGTQMLAAFATGTATNHELQTRDSRGDNTDSGHNATEMMVPKDVDSVQADFDTIPLGPGDSVAAASPETTV